MILFFILSPKKRKKTNFPMFYVLPSHTYYLSNIYYTLFYAVQPFSKLYSEIEKSNRYKNIETYIGL